MPCLRPVSFVLLLLASVPAMASAQAKAPPKAVTAAADYVAKLAAKQLVCPGGTKDIEGKLADRRSATFARDEVAIRQWLTEFLGGKAALPARLYEAFTYNDLIGEFKDGASNLDSIRKRAEQNDVSDINFVIRPEIFGSYLRLPSAYFGRPVELDRNQCRPRGAYRLYRLELSEPAAAFGPADDQYAHIIYFLLDARGTIVELRSARID